MHPPRTFEALTFDCYGTLIDWETGILAALREMLQSRGVSASERELLSLYAEHEARHESGEYLPYREVLARVAEGIAGQFGFSLREDERTRLADSIANWEPFPDTVAALRLLEKRFRLVICSNIDDDLFAASNRKLGVTFDRVVTAQYCRSYKPNPRHFRVALALLDLPPTRVLHVAESLYHDVKPARTLGFTTAWINRRAARGGGAGASGTADATPHMEFPDLASLAKAIG